MSKTTKIIVSILALVAVIWGITALSDSGDTGDTATTTPDDNQAATVPENWEEYSSENFDFTFAHPPEAEVSTEAGRVKIQILGENNEEGTEVTDGLTGYIYTEPIAQGGLEATANQIFQEEREGSEGVITPVESGDFAGRSGYSFQLRSQLNSTSTYHVLPASEGQAYIVTYTASGPNSDMYVDTFETIVSSLSFTTDGAADDNSSNNNGDTGATTSPGDSAGDSQATYAQACQDAGGNWLAQHNECEGVMESWCTARDGAYESCASACRHDPNAEVCTDQCVRVCSL